MQAADGVAEIAAVDLDDLGLEHVLSGDLGELGAVVVGLGVEAHDVVLPVVGDLEPRREEAHGGGGAEDGVEARRLHGLGRGRVPVADEEVLFAVAFGRPRPGRPARRFPTR